VKEEIISGTLDILLLQLKES